MVDRPAQWRDAVLPFALRTVGYFLFWIVLAGTEGKDLAAGFLTALVAAWASLRLLPPGTLAFKPAKAAGLFLRFLGQSVTAGVTVACIAFDPRLPLKPGVVRIRPEFPEGTRRFAYLTFVSLLPGTLPLSSEDKDGIGVHCLDTSQPVIAQLAKEEEKLRAALTTERAS